MRGQAAWRRERTRIVAAEHEALGKCFRHQMRAGARVKFPRGISHVCSNRVMRDVQLVGDLATGVSESHQPHNLALAGGERNGFGAGRYCPAEARPPPGGAQDDELLQLFNIPRELLPEICSSSEFIAEATTPYFAGTPSSLSSMGDGYTLSISQRM